MNTDSSATQGPFESRKEEPAKDLKGLVSDADDLLKEVAHSTALGFAAARSNVEGRLGEARSRLDDARVSALQKARGAADATHEYVRDNPGKAIGVAAAAGVIIGFLLSRR